MNFTPKMLSRAAAQKICSHRALDMENPRIPAWWNWEGPSGIIQCNPLAAAGTPRTVPRMESRWVWNLMIGLDDLEGIFQPD